MATEVKKVYTLDIQGADSVNELTSAIEQLNEKLKTLNETSKEYKETLEELTKLQGQLSDLMNGISDSADKTEKSISGISDKINEMGETISDVGEAIDSLGDIKGDVIESFVDGFVEGMGEAADFVDDIEEKLNNLEDVDASVTVEVDDSSLDNVTTTLDNLDDSTVSVNVEVPDESLKVVSEDINNIKENLEGVNDEAEKTSDTLNNIGGVSSVKELKKEISDLRDRLVTLDKGSDEYSETVKKLIDDQVKLKEVMNAGKNETQAAEGSYNALTQRMSALRQVWKETTDEATRNEIGRQIAEINTQLKDMDASIGNFQRNVGNYKSALEGLDGSFVNLKTQLRECKEAMQQMDPASQEYADAMAKAADITHKLADQQEMIRYASPDLGDQLNNIRGIASNLAAGYSAVNAAMGLFGEENEEVAQAMLKVQQAMALVQGLQGIDGFIKRTKGLSQSMGLVTKATQANTVATKANAAATKADAAAKGAEAVATQGAVGPQLALNAAMKANPIGFIIGLIAALVTAFMLLKDKIVELIGANDNMSKAFDKVKAVLAGFGNIIKKSVINPVKMAIIPINTLAKVMIDLFNGDWSKIGDDFKDGMEEMKDTVIDTINYVGSFKEGYDKKTAEQAEAARKKEAEARAKEKDAYIKDMEAKYDSTWKYTEKGKKEYLEYFNALIEMYDKDSEEYKQALRDKDAYLRDFNENAQKEAESLAATELKLDVARYGEQVKYSEKWYDYEKKLHQKALDLYDAYKDAYGKFPTAEAEKEFMEAELRWETYLKARNDYYKKQNDDLTKETDKLKNDFKTKFDSLVDDSWKALRSAQETADALAKTLQKGGKDYKAIELYLAEWEELFKTIGAWNDDEIKEKLAMIRADIESGAVKKSWDTYVKSISTKLEKELYNMDKTASAFIDDLQQKFNEKKFEMGIVFPEGEIDHIVDLYTSQINTISAETSAVTEQIDFLFDVLKQNFGDVSKEVLGQNLPEFQKLLDKQSELMTKQAQLELEQRQKISDVYKQMLENDTKELQKAYDSAVKYSEKRNELLSADAQELSEEWGFVTDAFVNNSVQQFYRGKEEINAYYDYLKAYYERMKKTYLEYAESEFLSEEERKKATEEAEKYRTLVSQTEADRRIEIAKNEIDAVKKWKNEFKQIVSSLGDALGSLSDYYNGLMELEKAEIDQQLESGKIKKKEAEKLYETQKEAFEKSKKFEAAQAMINGLSAAVGAYNSLASIPYVGPILGAAAAAAALAAAVVNVQKIKATTFENPYSESNSSAGGGSSSTNFQLPDVMATEPELRQNMTGMSDTDSLNNDGGNGNGNGRGKGGDTTIRAYIVESEVTASQDLARKRSNEVTF